MKKISYVSPDGVRLTYSVEQYEVINGVFIRFLDRKTNKTISLPITNVKIEENENDNERYS